MIKRSWKTSQILKQENGYFEVVLTPRCDAHCGVRLPGVHPSVESSDTNFSKNTAVCILPRSQALRCAFQRGVKLHGVHHTTEWNCTLRSNNLNLGESLVAFKGTIRRNPFRSEHIYYERKDLKKHFLIWLACLTISTRDLNHRQVKDFNLLQLNLIFLFAIAESLYSVATKPPIGYTSSQSEESMVPVLRSDPKMEKLIVSLVCRGPPNTCPKKAVRLVLLSIELIVHSIDLQMVKKKHLMNQFSYWSQKHLSLLCVKYTLMRKCWRACKHQISAMKWRHLHFPLSRY